MGKLGKIIAVLLGLVIVVVGAAAVFVKVYLTEERLKSIIIPQAETALGRKVSIGGIDVSLFSGITVRDVAIKEKDPGQDFVRGKAFVLRYDLMPLLQGRVDITKILLDEPYVRVSRDKNGTFNFETLAILSTEKKPAAEPAAKGAPASLPVALTVRSVAVKGARLEVRDAKAEIPEVDGKADLDLSLEIGKDLASFAYRGTADFAVDLRHGDLSPSAKGNLKIDMKRLGYSVDMEVDQQKLNVKGEVTDYLRAPQVRIDVSSKALSIDRLMALASALPTTAGETPKKEPPKARAEAGPMAEAIPQGVTVAGTVRIDTTTYQDLAIRDFAMDFGLARGILAVTKLAAKVADGTIDGTAAADLTKSQIAWNGVLKTDSIGIAEVVAGLAPKGKGSVEGRADGDFTYRGRGTAWPAIRESLDLTGTYGASDLVIRAPITEAVAGLLGLSELREMKFERADGNVRIENGIVRLKSKMGGESLSAHADGDIGLDGKIDLPVILFISEELGAKLRAKASVAKYLVKEKGETELSLKIAGTLGSPRPALDEKAVQKKVEDEVTKQATKALEGFLAGEKKGAGTGTDGAGDQPKGQQEGQEKDQEKKESPAEQMIKGIFGK